jgi:hypothetical protein
MSDKIKRSQIIKDYADLHKKLNRAPKMDELVQKKYTKDSIKHHFSSLSKLDDEARSEHPDCFFDVAIGDIINDTAIKALRDRISKHKRFVVTTAVTGCTVDEKFYASIKSYCKHNDALLLVLVASDPAHTKVNNKGGYGTVDQRLTSECIVFEDTELNSNLFLSTIKLSAKHIDPTTGLDRIGQRDGTFIFASPKQRLNMVATSNIKLPHGLMTTGAITQPNYKTDMYMSERTAYLANVDHIMGALIVEIDNDLEYHFRQVQAAKDGSLIDLGTRYYPKSSPKKEAPEALVLGDWHASSTDPMVQQCTSQMLALLKPKYAVLHDAFDGLSINHHEEDNKLAKAVRFKNGMPSLEDEITILSKDLVWFSGLVDEVVVVKSNHDEFLSKHYLNKAKYAEDPQNHFYSLDLAKAMMNGEDPLRYAVERKLSPPVKNISWLKRDEDFVVAGIQLGAHGDKGPNGSRGSLQNMEKAYGLSVTGHSHTPGILRGAWAVGTSSYLKLNYNEGPSSWLQTHCIVYKDGSRQLINMINGKWRMKK